MRNCVWTAMIIALIAMFNPAAGRAQTAPTASAVAGQCAALQAADFSGVLDAPTQITAAKSTAAVDGAPATCRVQGYVTPNVLFELWLPEANWNGKFAHIGCGGFCGTPLTLRACPPVVARGYACISTNMGHSSTALDAKWAYNNLQAEVDFGFRSTHVTVLAGKAITAAYYGRSPVRAYHLGCSTGGRQGMMEAERFPTDFDGILAGAPPINETGDGLVLFWNVMATLGPDGRSILSFDDLKTLHAAAIAACDLDDKVKDGVIADPRRCRFDPASLRCGASGQGGGCLNEAQIAAVRKIYGGPVNSKGVSLYPARALPGSELNWMNNYVAADGGPSIYNKFIGDMMRYMNFMPAPGPSWKVTDFNWDRDPQRLDLMETLYSASNPDLRRFKAAGGKLIVYQGWADQSVLPENIIDYYQTAERTMGGPAATRDFFRLFMIPGMNHCAGGAGADYVDFLNYLEAWVERGEAPATMLAYHAKSTPDFGHPLGSPPPSPAETEFTRPLYPYPLAAAYDGKGDPTKAASYRPQ